MISSYNYGGSAYYTYAGYIYKYGGSFAIDHPDPSKTACKQLIHSFVESPTAGDNIYRYKICTTNCQAVLELPDYYKFLNEHDHIHTQPVKHFGNAYGIMDDTQSCVNFTSNCDGEYDVLIIGTRKDKFAHNSWRGVEVAKRHKSQTA
jgi:hypothetical protein